MGSVIECKLYGDTDGVTKDIFSSFIFLEDIWRA